MSKNNSSGGLGGLVFFVIFLIVLVPKPIWIALGVVLTVAVGGWIVHEIVKSSRQARADAELRAKAERVERAEAAKREREQRDRREKQHRIATLGAQNASVVESTLRAVQSVARSEAARAGWLGDVDFSADITYLTDNFERAYALRGVTRKLTALANPTADDRKILDEATATITDLERAATERAQLIDRCATEASLIDQSLQTERKDAEVAEERAELHAKLSAMLYGIEAAPTATPTNSAVDAVLARVQAYREIKNQIQQARTTD